MKQNCVDLEYKKYPAQMLEVAGDLRRAPAKFENPGLLVLRNERVTRRGYESRAVFFFFFWPIPASLRRVPNVLRKEGPSY